MKDILVIEGGGRANGNTARLVNAFVKGVESVGHNVTRFSLLKTRYKAVWGAMPADTASRVCKRTRLTISRPKSDLRTVSFWRRPCISGHYPPA